MWHLKRNDTGAVFYLLTNNEYKIGAANAHHDLPIEGVDGVKKDTSISRKHAVIKVTYGKEDEDVIERHPVVSLCDLKSTYGTFINEGIDKSTKIISNHDFKIHNNDRIRFGLQWNIWQLSITPLVVVASTLSTEAKSEVRENVMKLGGHLVENWVPECTFLTMESIKMTIKVVCALAQGIPIVTANFWNAWVTAISLKRGQNGFMMQREPPNPADFLPPLQESMLSDKDAVLFAVNTDRRTLFKGKTFIFTKSKTCQRMIPAITSAGGKAETWNNCKLSTEQKCSKNVILVQNSISDTQSQDSMILKDFEDAQDLLAMKKMRNIPEAEIGLAILYNSMETHCNPFFNPELLISTKREIADDHTQVVLAPETQSQMNPMPSTSTVDSKKRSVTIMESLEPDDRDAANLRAQSTASKKPRIENTMDTSIEMSASASQVALKKPSLPISSILTFKEAGEEFLSVPKTSQKKSLDAISDSTDATNTKNQNKPSSKPSEEIVREKLRKTALSDDEEDVFGFEDTNLDKYKTQSGSSHLKQSSAVASELNLPSSFDDALEEVIGHRTQKRLIVSDDNDSDIEKPRPLKVPKVAQQSESDEEDVFGFENTKISSLPSTSSIKPQAPRAQSTQKRTVKSPVTVPTHTAPRIAQHSAPQATKSRNQNVIADDTEWIEIPRIKEEDTTMDSHLGDGQDTAEVTIKVITAPLNVSVRKTTNKPMTTENNVTLRVNFKKFNKSMHPQVGQHLPTIFSFADMAKVDLRTGELITDGTDITGNRNEAEDIDKEEEIDWAFQDLNRIKPSTSTRQTGRSRARK